MPSESSLPWPRVAGFVNQLTHDLRNDINSLALGLDLLKSSLADPESLESAARLNDHIRTAGARLREISARIADPKPNSAKISAHDLFLIWQDQAFQLGINAAWSHTLGTEQLTIDVAGVSRALAELLVNARQFGDGLGLIAAAGIFGKEVVFELQEPKPNPLDPTEWGVAPFQSTQRAHYGLGLWESDRLVRASGGEIKRQWLATGKLVTKFKFPSEP